VVTDRHFVDEVPCADCAYLVAAGPSRKPHPSLLSLETEFGGKGAFQCGVCRFRWICGPLGWSRLLA
jgi:hypothetical protein